MNPEEIVEAQLKAYNRKDVEECLSYYADNVEILILPTSEVLFNSKQDIRANVVQAIETGDFEESLLVEKITGGRFVTLVEQKGARKAIFHYYVGQSQLIEKVWVSPIE